MNKLSSILMAILCLIAGCSDQAANPATMTINTLLAGNDSDHFASADHIREFQFPSDHGPHPQYRNEWWYITGNVFDETNNRYGYQLTFFRRALQPDQLINQGWQDKNLYMAHFAISNHRTGEFLAQEKFGRNGAHLAGAEADPFRVWLDDWEIFSMGRDFFPLKLKAKNKHYAIDLVLNSDKALILQGNQGLSQKSAEVGNASYYYSFTRLQTSGTIMHQQQTLPVKGSSWFDREWSTSALAANQQGWDWFALQLDSGEEVMFYQLRQLDGSISPESSGIIVTPEGLTLALSSKDITLEATDYWQQQQHRYPVRWRMQIHHQRFQADWIISTELQHQFLNLSIPYWEGAITISEQSNGNTLGIGFMELTGY